MFDLKSNVFYSFSYDKHINICFTKLWKESLFYLYITNILIKAWSKSTETESLNIVSYEIILTSCWLHGFSFVTLTINPYHPSLLVGLLDCIQCLYRSDVSWLVNTGVVEYSHNKYTYIHIYIYMLNTYWRNKNRRAKTSLNKYISHFICNICMIEELETEQNCNILTPTLIAISVVSFSFSWCSTGGPGAHSAGFLYCILSPTGLVPKLHRGSWGPLWLGVAFPTTSRL